MVKSNFTIILCSYKSYVNVPHLLVMEFKRLLVSEPDFYKVKQGALTYSTAHFFIQAHRWPAGVKKKKTETLHYGYIAKL